MNPRKANISLLFFISPFLENLIKCDVVHYQDVFINTTAPFKITKTVQTSSKEHCGVKCIRNSLECSAFCYEEASNTCSLGKIHPRHVSCDGGIEKVSTSSNIFEPNTMIQFAIFYLNQTSYYYNLDESVGDPEGIIPQSADWTTETDWDNILKFFVNEAFHFCPAFKLTENCRKWDAEASDWIELPGRPSHYHSAGAIVPFEDGKVAFMGGRSPGRWPYVNNELMNKDGYFSQLVSFNSRTTDLGACPISNEKLITVGGNVGVDPQVRSTEAWLFDVAKNTKTALAPMNHDRTHPVCSKLNPDEIIVMSSWAYVKHVEVYNIIENSWTVRPEYYLPVWQFQYPRLIIFKGRMLLLGGQDESHVWEWDSVDGWVQKEHSLPVATSDWNGGIIPFFKNYPKPNCSL